MNFPNSIKNDKWKEDLYKTTYDDLNDIGLYTTLDQSLLERFVLTSYDIHLMETTVATETNGTGFIIGTKSGLSEIHPLVRPINEKMRILQQQMESLGLSPKSRRLLVKKTEEKEDFSEFEFLEE